MNEINSAKNARCNWLSLECFVLAIIFGLLTGKGAFSGGSCGDWGLSCFVGGIVLAAALCLLGVIAACVALMRKEKIKWLSYLGLVINGLPVIAVLVFAIRIIFR